MLLKVYIIFLFLSAEFIMIFPMIIVVIAAVIISTGVLSADFFRCCNCCRLFTETVLSAVIVSVVLWTAVVSVSVRTIVIVSIS